MPFDPTLPVNISLVSSSELRNQFTGLKRIIDLNANNAATSLVNTIAGTAVNQSISHPPTQAQVQAIQNTINELIRDHAAGGVVTTSSNCGRLFVMAN